MKVVASIADSKGLAQDCVVCVCVWSVCVCVGVCVGVGVVSVVLDTDNTCTVPTLSSVGGASVLSCQECRVPFSFPHIFLCARESQL